MGQDPNLHPSEDISGYKPDARASVLKWRSLSHWTTFLAEMRRLLQAEPDSQFFVCCDEQKIFDHLHLELNDAIFTRRRQVFDRSVDQVQTALVDLLLLGK